MNTGIRLLLFLFAWLMMNTSCDKNQQPVQVVSPDQQADLEWPADNTRVVADGFNQPWEILWGRDNLIWMTERNGKISRIDPKTGTINFSFTLPDVVASGEGGLLGMVQHPEFPANGFLYVVHNYRQNGTAYREKVIRLTFKNNTLSDALTLIDNIPAASIHNGSRLVFTTDNKLLISTGDAANPAAAQDATSLSGKILRINPDGSIPADNPIHGSPVWSMGHRNPQGLVQVANVVYASEHGPSIEDEVNMIEKGRNYGWPTVNGPCNDTEVAFCSAANVKEPIWSSGSFTVATSGMEYYNADRIDQWKHSLLLATLKDATLYQLKLSTDGKSIQGVKPYFKSKWGRLRDVCVSPAGRIYLCTANGNNTDRLIEIQKPE
jgi:glucose/arabinose dehydrogenase